MINLVAPFIENYGIRGIMWDNIGANIYHKPWNNIVKNINDNITNNIRLNIYFSIKLNVNSIKRNIKSKAVRHKQK